MNIRRVVTRKDCIVIATVAVLLIIVDVTLITVEKKLSKNILQISKYPEVVENIQKADKPTILIFGNSLIDNAVDPELLEQDFSRKGQNRFEVFKLSADSSGIWDWYCILKNNFNTGSRMPNIIITGFAWNELTDQEDPNPSRLDLFCDIGDLPDLYRLGLRSMDEVSEFLAAKILNIYAEREPISKRILTYLIPYYKDSVTRMNDNGNAASDNKTQIKKNFSYNVLQNFLSLGVDSKTKFIFIAMPLSYDYKIPGDLNDFISNAGGVLLDYRDPHIFKTYLYRDPIHLDKLGRRIFTSKLARDF